MRTFLRSKVTLLFMTCAVILFVFPAMASAQGAPTIQSDQADYPPGATVTLSGSGWQPGESVHINVNDTYGATWTRNVDVTANANGEITDSFSLPNSFVSDYNVTATGASGAIAKTTFTDADLAIQGSTANATQGDTRSYTAVVQGGGNGCQTPVTWSASNATVSPTSAAIGSPVTVTFNNTGTASITVTSPHTTGGGNCSNTINVTVNSGVRSTSTAVTASPSPSTYGDNVTFTATVNSSAGSPTAGQGTVTFKEGTTTLCSNAALNSTSKATCSTEEFGSSLGAGAHTITADYSGVSTGSPQFASSSGLVSQTVNKASSTTTVTCTGGPFTYTGNPITPCSANVSGVGGLNQAVTPVSYDNNTGAGTATASATFAGDANHNGSSDTEEFTIGKASSTTTVTCTGGPFTYTVNPITPCSANVSGVGGLNQAVTPVSYDNNTGAGTATASATFAGDANHNGSSDTEEFTIGKASSTTTVTCTGGPFTYTGNPITPCSANVSGVGGL